jgi:hypothetical protein
MRRLRNQTLTNVKYPTSKKDPTFSVILIHLLDSSSTNPYAKIGWIGTETLLTSETNEDFTANRQISPELAIVRSPPGFLSRERLYLWCVPLEVYNVDRSELDIGLVEQ